MKTIQVLLVDDEKSVLESVSRALHTHQENIELVMTNLSKEAITLLASKQFDIMISDITMPDMDGYDLMRHVQQNHPEVIRVLFTGKPNLERTPQSLRCWHQFIAKPLKAKDIAQRILEMGRTRKFLNTPESLKIVASLEKVPNAPGTYLSLISKLNDPDTSLKEIAEIISNDVGVTAKLLQLVNSAYFGFSRKIKNLEEAVSYLGIETIKMLVLSIDFFSQYDSENLMWFSIDEINEHSLQVAFVAQQICHKISSVPDDAEIALTGGLLHDIGKIVLATNLPEKYAQVFQEHQSTGKPFWEIERRVIGVNHSRIGGYLLGIWGLPNEIVDVAGFHHEPLESDTPQSKSLAAVHLANGLVNCFNQNEENLFDYLNEEYLESVGLNEQLEHLKEFAMECWQEFHF